MDFHHLHHAGFGRRFPYVPLLAPDVPNQPRRCRMKLYVGDDLHANNNFLALVDRKGKRVDQKKLPTDLFVLRDFLKPYQKDIIGIAVESTFNWYWLVDGLIDGFRL
jgi:hypothetical protein